MQIKARFASTCPKCGKEIEVGSLAEWEKGKKAEHVTCPKTEIEHIIDSCHDSIPRLLLRARGARREIARHKEELAKLEAMTRRETIHCGWMISHERSLQQERQRHAAIIEHIRRLRLMSAHRPA